MASASSASEGARSKDAPLPCACGAMISAKDTHPLCIVCLGVRHAQAALANPECCPHCSPFPSRVLERRVRVAAANKGDPSLSPPTTVETKQPPVSCSWGDFMDEVSPDLPPLFPILAEEREEEEDDDEAIARLLEEDGEEDDDDAILPSTPSWPGSALSDGSPASAQVELDLLEMCRRAAAKLSIDWPSQQAGQGMERDLYDGKRLPSRAPAVKQVIPAVPACVSEMKRFWDKPFSHRVPVKGFSRLDVHNMEELGMSNPPPVELSVAHHLNPNRRAAFSSASASLPGRTERLTASVFQKIYRSSALAVRALNATSLLTAYQAELMEEMGRQMDAGSPNPALWEEICVIADLNLRTSRGAVQSCGRSMGLAVVGERALWLGLSGLSDREKVDFLDAPVEPKALFGASVTAMRQRCDLRKQEGEAFQACLPRKPIPKGPPSSRPGFDAPLRSSQSAFRSPRPPQPQQSDAQSKPAQPKGKPSFAAAAARHRPANPQGGKKRRAT
ncbi:putative GAG protein [Labeo rohita]|uniref:Putative GAG protein n=1 Tax=Labeo rohita TaxID=84645 RepID=A0A498M517_LABRO|nr:putative GAG protein [Labeo rohita]